VTSEHADAVRLSVSLPYFRQTWVIQTATTNEARINQNPTLVFIQHLEGDEPVAALCSSFS